jgi:hypothetical protein
VTAGRSHEFHVASAGDDGAPGMAERGFATLRRTQVTAGNGLLAETAGVVG